MATFAITGSSGYVGTRMTRWLLDADPAHRVIGFDVRPPRISDERLEFHQLDVRDVSLGERLRGRGVQTLMHFAFVLDPMYDEAEMHDIDVGGTRNVLAAVKTAGIGHLVATSSTTAYGARPDNPTPLHESDPLRAIETFRYAHDKRLMDELLQSFAREHPDIAVCIVRPCIVLGPNVGNYIAAMMIAQPAPALIDGRDVPLQYVHEDDLVRLIARCVERRAAGAFNAVGEGVLTTREAARLQGKRALPVPHVALRAAVWGVWKLRLLDFSLPPGILDFFRWPWIASGDKARRELDFVPAHSSRACFEILLSRKDEVRRAFRDQMRARGKR
jgi:UDP-glucose 4-epimerase